MGTLIGIGSSFAVVLTLVGVSIAWSGELTEQSVANAFRAAVSKAAEDNDQLKDALKVTEDGSFDFDDVDFDGDGDLYDPNAKDDVA